MFIDPEVKRFFFEFFLFYRNKYYGIIFKRNIKRKAQYKIINHKEYIYHLLKGDSVSERNILLNFTDKYRLICQDKDLGAIGEVCILEDYQRIRKYQICPGDIIFDVGAHIGSFSVYAANKGAIVYAFEPENRNYNVLIKNIQINKLEKNINPFKLGIYKFNGELSLFRSKSNPGGHSVIRNKEFKKGLKIKTRTISDICQKFRIDKINLLKIDVEGAEYDIFSNMSPSTFKIIDKIVGEYHLFPNKPNLNFLYIKSLLRPYFKKIRHLHPYYFYAKK